MKQGSSAFQTLVLRHQKAALNLIRRHVNSPEDARDILQDTLLAAWLALSHYQAARPFDVWLRHIALNKCRDRARRISVRAPIAGLQGSAEPPDVVDSAPGPAALVENDQELRRLDRNFRRVSKALIEPLWLTSIEGLSHVEAAALLGISSKAVEMRVSRARVRLQELGTV